MSSFRTPQLKELTDQQVRFAPVARRKEQVSKANKLLAEIDPDRQYPYQYLCYRLTEYRSENFADLLILGADARHDLALFATLVERSLPPTPIELCAEPMLTLEEVSKQFGVSTKTINRWRAEGLTPRRVKRGDRTQLGYPQSEVESFANRFKERIAKAKGFTHMTESEKDQIVMTARQLAANGGNKTELTKKIAAELGRSVEAVRYTIKNFDQAHPDSPVFPVSRQPLNTEQRQAIVSDYSEGQPMDLVRKKHNRSRSSIHRIVNESRAEELLRTPVDYIYNEDFDKPELHDLMAGPMPGEDLFFAKMREMKPPKDVDAQMAHLYEKPLLSKEQEVHLFRKMNFLKHKLQKLKQTISASRVRVLDLQAIEELDRQIKETRDLLIECNQRLVHKLATTHVQIGQSLDELKSDANISLMRAVEKFDYGRGFKFSTYATWAIVKNFARSIPDETTHRQRYVTGHDEVFDSKADLHTDEQELLASAEQAKRKVNRLLEHLDPRTREVIRMRTGIDGSEEMTLEQIGQHFGITKERVRQINVRGMKLLREWAAQDNIEVQ